MEWSVVHRFARLLHVDWNVNRDLPSINVDQVRCLLFWFGCIELRDVCLAVRPRYPLSVVDTHSVTFHQVWHITTQGPFKPHCHLLLQTSYETHSASHLWKTRIRLRAVSQKNLTYFLILYPKIKIEWNEKSQNVVILCVCVPFSIDE